MFSFELSSAELFSFQLAGAPASVAGRSWGDLNVSPLPRG
jgi:hypothetical protein